MYETILYSVANGVATVTLNRPDRLNAFNELMILESVRVLEEIGKDQNIRCVVITGAGKAFSAGQDLKDFRDREASFAIGDHIRSGYNRLVLSMVELEVPVIAAVNGVAAGAGCGLALAADLRIVSHKASFMQAFSKVGLIPDCGSTWTLPRLIGYARAFEMAATAEQITADKALQWGLVNEVVPHDQLMEVVTAWALSLASGPTLALGLTKKAMRESYSLNLAEALEYEATLQDLTGKSLDFHEGVNAFIEKRDPKFKGK